jgi:hypothetical protein
MSCRQRILFVGVGAATIFLFIGIAGYVFLLGNMAPIPEPGVKLPSVGRERIA